MISTRRLIFPIQLAVLAIIVSCSAPQESTTVNTEENAQLGVNARAIKPIDAISPSLRQYATVVPTITFDERTLSMVRAMNGSQTENLPDGVISRKIPSKYGTHEIEVLVVDPEPDVSGKPAYLHMHGGGYILGAVRDGADRLRDLALICDCLVVSVEYRLAPETPFPGPLEDNLSALQWLHDNADALGIDPERIAIGGESAGGGHAAQLSIAARDNDIPVAFQVLIYPMLDDRTGNETPVPDHIGHYIWNGDSNRFAWTAYLGQPAGSDSPPYGAVPARVQDLSDLPPAWIGVGTADLFLSENLRYAERLIEAGVFVELYVSPGAFHGFDFFASETVPAQAFTQSWQSALVEALQHNTE